MSYSIGATRATKQELETEIVAELQKIPINQPAHELDIKQAVNAAKSLIDLMQNDPSRDLRCSVAGSIWTKETGVEQVNLNINLNYQGRTA